MDNLQIKYKVLTKAYSVGVASHFLAIVVNKWECVYMYNLQRKIYGPKEGLYGRRGMSLFLL
jgi:hypothetical protein